MEQVPPTSFVPRPTGSSVVQTPVRRHRRLNLLSFFAVILFFGSLILAVGVFVLLKASEDTLAKRQEELRSKRALFKTEDIVSVQLLDARIRASTQLLDEHVSPLRLLDTLERNTQEEIQFKSFSFERRPSGNIGVKMEGVAPRFNTVARQAQRFADESMFRRVIFSNLNKPDSDYVTFNVDLDIARDAIAYVAPVIPVADEFASTTTEATLIQEVAPLDTETTTTNTDPL